MIQAPVERKTGRMWLSSAFSGLRAGDWAAAGMAAAFTVLFTALMIRRHDAFHTFALDLAKFESGKLKLDIRPGNVNDIIKEVVETQKSVAEKKGIYLKMTLDPNLSEIRFDCDKMTQVLHNLVGNAIKFTSEGGVEVSSADFRDKNYIRVCVKDTGKGTKI